MGELTVTSFDIDHGKTREGIISLVRAALVLAESRAGLVGLQEVDRLWPRSYFEDQAAVLAKTLAMHHLFVPFARLPGRLGGGLAVLSRYPVIHHTFHRPGTAESVLQRCTVDFEGTRVTCLNAKAYPGAWRSIVQICRGLRTPAILTVDAAPPVPVPGWLNAAAMGEEPVKRPLRHGRPTGAVFFSPHWRIKTSRVHRTQWSDHWPLTAVAELRAENGSDRE
ncbi:MAG: hypothetical protein M0Z41_03765 [Peptococcaceae bacterium]|jgi:endonuclease/exonuclease/phosphatase family metal-dependent hydrolase|nr:hypothetical protein [Peptococcaceae bacterium]